MAYVIAVVGVGCLANLALTLAVIRRLRRLSERLQAASGRRRPAGPPRLPVGAKVAEFAVATIDGQDVTLPGWTSRVLAVVSGQKAGASDFARQLGGVASVVVEPRSGPVATAFSVVGYPTFYLLSESGQVEASGARVLDIAALPV